MGARQYARVSVNLYIDQAAAGGVGGGGSALGVRERYGHMKKKLL